MESLVFVMGLAALLVALHFVVAAYLYRVALSGDGSGFDREKGTDERTPEAIDRRLDGTDGTVPCPTCGAPNDPCFKFCRRCVADLTATQRTAGGASAGRLGS